MENKNLFAALAAFQSEVPNLLKTDTVKVQTRGGSSYNFKYVPLDVAIETVQPIMAKHGLFMLQPLVDKFCIRTILGHESGESLSFDFDFSDWVILEADPETNTKRMTSQDLGGVVTYVRRYQFTTTLRLAADDDDDSNSANGNSYERQTKTPTTPAPKPTPKAQPTKPLPKPTKVEEAEETTDVIDDVIEGGTPIELPKKATPKPKPTPKPVKAEPADEPVGDVDYTVVIESFETKAELMSWWKELVAGLDATEKTRVAKEYSRAVATRATQLN